MPKDQFGNAWVTSGTTSNQVYYQTAYTNPYLWPQEWESPKERMILDTLYDLLRKLIVGGNWTEDERKDAVALIDKLEAEASLGTTTSLTKISQFSKGSGK